MSYPADEQLVEQAQAGERAAFAVLVERYWPRVCHWLVALTRSRQTAEDLTQDVFLRAWEALPRFAPGAGFRAWLFRIARNAWIDNGRRSPRPSGDEGLADAASAEPNPAADAGEREFHRRLAEAVERLPEEFRVPWMLRMQQAMKSSEAALVLDLEEETVRWRVFRARQLLVKELASFFDSQEPTP